LETCLEALPAAQHLLIVDFYTGEKRAGIKHRRALAKKLEISANALQVRTHRLRVRLQECVQNCMAQKSL